MHAYASPSHQFHNNEVAKRKTRKLAWGMGEFTCCQGFKSTDPDLLLSRTQLLSGIYGRLGNAKHVGFCSKLQLSCWVLQQVASVMYQPMVLIAMCRGKYKLVLSRVVCLLFEIL